MTSNGAAASDSGTPTGPDSRLHGEARGEHDKRGEADGTHPHADLPFLEDALENDQAQNPVSVSEHGGERGGKRGPATPATHSALDEPKPLWRGLLHAGTFPLTIAAGIVLIAVAHGTIAKWAAAIYMLSSMLLFGVSALYHRFNWKPATKQVFRRLDHANIFLLISGTYTPIALLALPLDKGIILLIAVWAGAFVGIGFRMFWLSAPRWLYVLLYVALGWAAFAFLGDIASANLAAMVLVLVGGLLYTLGSVVYGFKRPNPVPGVFGFHEIFHALTVLAFLCHWVAALLLVLDPVYLR